MEADAASAGGVRCTEADDGAGKQDRCEKGLHVSSVGLGRIAAPDHDLKLCDSTTLNIRTMSNISEPREDDLNAE